MDLQKPYPSEANYNRETRLGLAVYSLVSMREHLSPYKAMEDNR